MGRPCTLQYVVGCTTERSAPSAHLPLRTGGAASLLSGRAGGTNLDPITGFIRIIRTDAHRVEAGRRETRMYCSLMRPPQFRHSGISDRLSTNVIELRYESSESESVYIRSHCGAVRSIVTPWRRPSRRHRSSRGVGAATGAHRFFHASGPRVRHRGRHRAHKSVG